MCARGSTERDRRGVSSRNFNQPISEFLEVHNFLVVAQTSHQGNCPFLKNHGNFPGIWRMAAASILACGVCFKNFVKKSRKYMDPAWAPGVQRQIPDAGASRSLSSRAQQHHRGRFVGCSARAPQGPGLLWGCQEVPCTSINPPLQVAGTTYRVCSAEEEQGIKGHRDNNKVTGIMYDGQQLLRYSACFRGNDVSRIFLFLILVI